MPDDLWNEDGTLREIGQGKPKAKVVYFTDKCPLCGGKLAPLWSPSSDERRCTNCGAHHGEATR